MLSRAALFIQLPSYIWAPEERWKLKIVLLFKMWRRRSRKESESLDRYLDHAFFFITSQDFSLLCRVQINSKKISPICKWQIDDKLKWLNGTFAKYKRWFWTVENPVPPPCKNVVHAVHELKFSLFPWSFLLTRENWLRLLVGL